MAAGKQAKTDVDYRLAAAHGLHARCGLCTMWRARAAGLGSCTAVKGPILAIAVCDLFQRRRGPARRE